MLVSLYTSRVILQVLGVEDYGIYNLVAGFVTFFAFISNALVSAMQRFFNTALGKGDVAQYREIYSTSINVVVLFAAVIFLLGETVGLWFVKTQLNIPSERFAAAIGVYQISLLTFVVNIMRSSFNASIIAHERMSFYAYVSIFEAAARLAIVVALQRVGGDKLVAYTWLYLAVTAVMTLVNWSYCRVKFEECRYSLGFNRERFRSLLSFSGWSLVGQSAVVIRNQGEAVLINRFFSVVANAALGIAHQVTGALDMFVNNFQTAFNPQIVKTYAARELEQHYLLVCRAGKFSYFLFLALSIPIVFNIDAILGWWLGSVPEYVDMFCIFIVASHLLNAMSVPMTTSIYATGNIKHFQIWYAATFLGGLVLSFVCLLLGQPPYVVSVVGIVIQVVVFALRLHYVRKTVGLNIRDFVEKTILPAAAVTLIVVLFAYVVNRFVHNAATSLVAILLDGLCAAGAIFCLGLTKAEREKIVSLCANFIKSRKK